MPTLATSDTFGFHVFGDYRRPSSTAFQWKTYIGVFLHGIEYLYCAFGASLGLDRIVKRGYYSQRFTALFTLHDALRRTKTTCDTVYGCIKQHAIGSGAA
jgi:hypothetical protein